jgi:hypothetical protein
LTRAAVAVFLLLVGATFGAFFVAQRLKGATALVELRGATSPFSPNGDGIRDVKTFFVLVRTADHATVDIVDSQGNQVRRIADGISVRPGHPRRVRWDGRADDGRIVPDGFYGIRVGLEASGRSVIVPAKIRVDTRAPKPYVRSITPGRIVAPGAKDIAVTAARISRHTPTQIAVWRTDGAKPHQVATGEMPPGEHTWHWNGQVGARPAPAGLYLFQITVSDAAGNVGRVPRQVELGEPPVPGDPGLVIRALAVQPPTSPVTAGTKVTVGVDSRHRQYTWQLRRVGRSKPVLRGRSSSPQLTFKAPSGASGLYLLALQASGDSARVPILVQAATRSKVLVVVPMITWLGQAQVDDGTDGIPDTLDAGGPVSWPRTLPGLPAGLLGEVAPLLVFLDRANVHYDLTTDLALTLDGGPRVTDRPGVLLAGTERWITPGLAKRLRGYVTDGGRLAMIGVDDLRRAVTVVAAQGGASGRFVRPTQPVDRDPFGSRLRKLATLPAGTELQPIAGGASAPLLAFWDGTLGGFATAEETDLPEPGDGVKVLAGIGVEPPASESDTTLPPPPRPAITEAQLGKGTVVRIGLPGWAQHLGKDPDVDQLTSNAMAILAGVKPKPGSLRR